MGDCPSGHPNLRVISEGFRQIMEGGLGLDMSDPNFHETPDRVARAYVEMLYGLFESYKVDDILRQAFPVGGYDGIVLAGPFETYSMCPHHFLPVTYQMFVGYIPRLGGRYLGISKLVRVSEILAKRPVLQEQLGSDICDALSSLKPQGIAVVIKGLHLCMMCRGVRKNTPITTSCIKGCFDKEPAARQELFDLMKMARM